MATGPRRSEFPALCRAEYEVANPRSSRSCLPLRRQTIAFSTLQCCCSHLLLPRWRVKASEQGSPLWFWRQHLRGLRSCAGRAGWVALLGERLKARADRFISSSMRAFFRRTARAAGAHRKVLRKQALQSSCSSWRHDALRACRVAEMRKTWRHHRASQKAGARVLLCYRRAHPADYNGLDSAKRCRGGRSRARENATRPGGGCPSWMAGFFWDGRAVPA